jgi:hypothetical protein
MTEATTPERRRPPVLMNRVMSTILRSPLHGMLSKEMMLISFTGRKSGKRFTTPVTMLPDGDGVKFFTGSPWYKNLVGGAPVSLHIAGRERSGSASVIDDPATVLGETKAFLQERGLKSAFRIGLSLDPQRPPSEEELIGLLSGRVLIKIRLS